jgi:uncharacterized protein YxjI
MSFGPNIGSIPSERFAYDKFLLNQKVMSLGGKYFIYNEQQQPLFYVDRPVFKIKAHIGIYEDESRARKILNVQQDSAWAIINLSFTLQDETGATIACLKRQGWLSMLRRTWKIYDRDGREIAQAAEDSWWKALMRRVPYLDIIGDFLRTNFILTAPDGRHIGEFIRRFTLADKYIMDLTADPSRTFDRRIAVALAIILDNAESR